MLLAIPMRHDNAWIVISPIRIPVKVCIFPSTLTYKLLTCSCFCIAVLPMRKLFSNISSMKLFLLDSIKNLSQKKRVVHIKSLQYFLILLLYRWRLLITHIFVVTVRFLLWPLCWQALIQFSPIKEWTEKTLTDIKVKLENKITLAKKFLGSSLRIPQNPISRHSCKFMELWPGHIYGKCC